MPGYDFLQSTVLRMDLLSSSPSFRVRKQSSYQTIFGGLFSLLIMIGFTFVLALQLQDMFNRLDITYSSGISDNIDSTSSISKLQMAVSIDNVDLSVHPRRFIFQLEQVSMGNQNGTVVFIKHPIRLSPCQKSDWTNIGSNFETQFDAFGFDRMLCIQPDQNYQLMGYIGSPDYKYLSFTIVQCDQVIDPFCDTSANVNTFMTNFLTTQDYFKVRFFLVDTILTPENDDAVSYIIQKNIFMAFTNTIGTVGFINMAEWTLTTDTSTLPYENNQQQTGHYIESFQTNSVSISSTKYVAVDFFRATKSLSISRTIGKIDSVLSYVGGLFSLIFTAIAFFVGSYSSMKYELYVAGKVLSSHYKDEKIGEISFGFPTYLAYCCYDWMDAFGIAPNFLQKLAKIHQTRQEACEQLDPTMMLKRIKYLQDVSAVLLTEHKQLALHLSQPMTLKQARRMRAIVEYYDKNLPQINCKIQGEDEKEDKYSSMKKIQNESSSILEEEIEQEVDSDEQQAILKCLMKAAISSLQKDESEMGNKIRAILDKKSGRFLQSTKKKYISSNGLQLIIKT